MKSSPPPLRSLTCPKCGAPLEVQADALTIRCQYCNDTIQNPYYRSGLEGGSPSAGERSTTPATAIRPVLLLILGLAACAGIVAAAGSFLGAGAMDRLLQGQLPQLETLLPLQIEQHGLWLPGDGAPNVLAITWDTTQDRYAVSRLDLGTHRALWSALAQKDYLIVDGLLAGDTLAYVVMDTRLVALQLSDGQQAWEASLPDELPGACQRCVLLAHGQVVALTTDGSLGAYDAQTGHQTWEKRFDRTGDALYPVGANVGLSYQIDVGAALVVLDPASGEERAHIEPTCAGSSLPDEMDADSDFVFDTSSDPVVAYVFYGIFKACVQRWNLLTGEMEWERVEEDQSLEYSGGSILFQDGMFYYAQEGQLRSLDAATGQQSQTLAEAQDYSLVPLWASGQRLLVRAKRTRGTSRFELWGYDLSTGQNLWKRPLPDSEPLDPPDEMVGLLDKDTSGWTYFPASDGLWLLTFQAQPNQVSLAQVNLDTGELGSQKALSLEVDTSSDFYDIPKRLESHDHLAWFVLLNRIYVVDPAAGAFAYRWP